MCLLLMGMERSGQGRNADADKAAIAAIRLRHQDLAEAKEAELVVRRAEATISRPTVHRIV